MNLACTTFPVRHLGAVALCVLAGGTGVGTALADPPAQTHDYFAQVASPRATVAVRPDDRGGVHGIGSTMVAAPQVSLGGGSGFDWGAAGIGAGSMLGAVLIAGSLFVVRGRFRAHGSRESSPAPVLHV